MVERLRAQLRHAILGNLLAYVAILLLVGGGLFFIDQRDTQRQHDICGLIRTLDETYHAAPPSSPTGQQIAAQVHDYRLRIGC